MSVFRDLLIANAGAGGYVTNGMIFHIDALNNTGNGVMDTTAETWVDLIGENDIALDLSVFSWQSSMCYQTASSSYNARTANSIFTAETAFTLDAAVRYTPNATSAWILAIRDTSTATAFTQIARYNAVNIVNYAKGSTTVEASVTTYPTTATITVGEDRIVNIYIGGVLAQTYDFSEATGGLTPLNQKLGIFNSPWAPTAGLSRAGNGIYAVRIYDRALSASEVARNATKDKSRYGI